MFMMSICVCVFVHVHIKQFHVAYSFRDNVSASINRQPIQNLRSLKRGNRSKYSDWLQATKDVLGVLICKETSCRAQPAMQRLQVTKWIKVVTPSRLFPASVLIGKGQPGVELSIELLCIYLASWTHSPSVQDSVQKITKVSAKKKFKKGPPGCLQWLELANSAGPEACSDFHQTSMHWQNGAIWRTSVHTTWWNKSTSL